MKNTWFYSKILLFGEYGITKKAKSISFPFPFFKGSLKFLDQNSKQEILSNQTLSEFSNFLNKISLETDLGLDLKSFESDVKKGLYFDSTIPRGYGVGSSGALVASVYSKYCIKKISLDKLRGKDLSKLKDILGKMESFFHGKSSGIDPLICYMNAPLLVDSDSNINLLDIPQKNGNGAIFLIRSDTPSSTSSMIEIFFEKLKNKGFRTTLKEEFIRYNDDCVKYFLQQEHSYLFDNLKKLSAWALENLTQMIPKDLIDVWREGIETDAYYLKLCGSGGGGYTLGFSKNFQKAKKMLEKYRPQVVLNF